MKHISNPIKDFFRKKLEENQDQMSKELRFLNDNVETIKKLNEDADICYKRIRELESIKENLIKLLKEVE